jgi:hypothetical protein
MSEEKLDGRDIKALLSPEGAFKILTGRKDLKKPFTPQDGQLLSLKFDTGPSKEIQLGSEGTVKLGIKADTNAQALLLWPDSPPDQLQNLETFRLQDYFSNNAHGDQLLLLLTIGAKLDGSADAAVKYSVLSANASLGAGGDGSYGMVRPFSKETPAQKVLLDFFKGIRLPAGVTVAPGEGEVIRLEYGGYLSFNAGLSAGYTISGTPSLEIKDLTLSEHYDLSLMGSLSLGTQLAGRFNIDVRRGSKDSWARVTVSKNKRKEFQVAADVKVNAQLQSQGLPESPYEFIEALLGLRAKNWINLFEKIKQFTDFNQLDAYLDNLAKSYIEELTGKAFDQLKNNRTLNSFIKFYNKALESYQNLGDYAVSIFDRYYDPIGNKMDNEVIKALDKIADLASLDQLRKTVLGNKLADLIYRLTDGNPLDWLLGKIKIDGKEVGSLETLKQRALNTLALVKDNAHKDIRKIIKTAKAKFPLDNFISGLKTVDLDQLQASANLKLTGFVERFIGKSIAGVSKSKLGKVVTKINGALGDIDQFSKTLYQKVEDTLNTTLQLGLEVGYNRTAEKKALLDVELNLDVELGRQLMKAVGCGNLSAVLEKYDPDVVLIHDGVLTHDVTRKTTVAFNIAGWHKEFKYQDISQVITHSEQHISSGDNGMLTVVTDIDLALSDDKNRQKEHVYTNMVLGFVGASSGAAVFNKATKRYMVDSITKMSGKYQLLLGDTNTTPEELREYLSYAVTFGIKKTVDGTWDALTPNLPTDGHGNYGNTSVDYQVRFSEEGLNSLFTGPLDETEIRRVIRGLTLLNYINTNKGWLHRRGWVYWTSWVYKIWKKHPADFPEIAKNYSPFKPIDPPPVILDGRPLVESLQAPREINMTETELFFINRLYHIENNIVGGLVDLRETLQHESGLSPLEYQKQLGKLGKALQNYNKVDKSVNTFFAVFDALIKASGKPSVRNSGLTLKAQIEDQANPITRMLMT